MKLKFDSNLEYQHDAINAVIDLFEGLPPKQGELELNFAFGDASENLGELGIGNRLQLEDPQILENLHTIQERNAIPKSHSMNDYPNYPFHNFSVEMETGTGKTYVYLRTLFEMNRKYGFKKFIIVVPSVAIREGVLSSIDIMNDHFKALYDNASFEHFIYRSKDLSKVRQFAVSNHIQVMIINIQAFQKDAGDIDIEDYSSLTDDQLKKLNVIFQPQDKMNGRRPIDYVRASNPIVIIDEPQSVDNTPKSQRAVKTLNPLFCLRYSAPISTPTTYSINSTPSVRMTCGW